MKLLNILISRKKQKNKIIIMEYFDFTRFFFTFMVTWGSNNYFVKFYVSLVRVWSEFGLNVLQT